MPISPNRLYLAFPVATPFDAARSAFFRRLTPVLWRHCEPETIEIWNGILWAGPVPHTATPKESFLPIYDTGQQYKLPL